LYVIKDGIISMYLGIPCSASAVKSVSIKQEI